MIFKRSSKASAFVHDGKQALAGSYGVVLLALAVFLLLMPFSTAGLPGSSIFNVEFTHQQLKFRFFAAGLAPVINGVAVAFGSILGLTLFRFLLDKKQATAFLSLGITRGKLFASRALVGGLSILAALGLPLLVSLWLNLAALGQTPGLFACFGYTLAGLVLLAFVAFLLAAMGCFLAGTLLEAVVFTSGLLAMVSVVSFAGHSFMKALLWGNPYGVAFYGGTTAICPNLMQQLAWLNPILFFQEDLTTRSMFYRSLTVAEPPPLSWGLLAGWLLAAAVLGCVAWLLLKKRRAEQAGIAGLNAGFANFTILLGSCTVFILVFCFFVKYGLVLAFALAFFLFGLVFLLLHSLLFRSRAQPWRTLCLLLGGAGLMACLVGVFAGGGLGFSQRQPAAAEVASVSCSYVGSPNYLFAPTSGISTGKTYYFTSAYTYDDAAGISQVMDRHRELMAAGKRPLAKAADFAQTVVPYDIAITYHLKKGKALTRYYDRASLQQLKAMLALDDNAAARTGVTQVLTGAAPAGEEAVWAAAAYQNGQVFLADRFYSKPQEVRFSAAKRQQLLAAIAQDVAAQTVAERYFPDEACLGAIMFTRDGENSKKTFAYQLENAFVYLTPGFTNTLAFLQQNGLAGLLQFNGKIESVTLQKYDPYGGINKRKTPVSNYFMAYLAGTVDEFWVEEDFGKKRPITDAEKLQQLLPNLQNAYFMAAEGYLAAVKVAGSGQYVYLYLPEEKAPGFLQRGKAE